MNKFVPETYGEDYGSPQRRPGDLEPRVSAVERRLDIVAINHERTLDWVKDLASEMKDVNTKLDALTAELYKLRESFAGQMGKWTGGAIVVSTILALAVTLIGKFL